MPTNVWSQTATELSPSSVIIGNGNTLVDDTGAARTVTFTNGAAVSDDYISFDGSDDLAEIVGSTDYNVTAEWTIELAIFHMLTVNATVDICNFAANAAVNGHRIRVLASTTVPRMEWRMTESSAGAASISGRTAADTIVVNAWNHIIITLTGGAAGTTQCYINGALSTNDLPGALTMANSNAKYRLGTANGGTPSKGLLKGPFHYKSLLSEIRIADRYQKFLTHPVNGGGGGGG